MKRQQVFLIFITLFLFNNDVSFAQNEEIVFGKVSKSDLEMVKYEPEPDAEAVILAKVSQLRINSSDNFKATNRNYFRIKILDESGLRWGKFSFDYVAGYETITRIKAMVTYPDGKQYKLKRKDVIRTKYEDNWRRVEFELPNLVKGSIVEYMYDAIVEDAYPMEDFIFQYEIPVRYADFSYFISGEFKYSEHFVNEKYIQRKSKGYFVENVPSLKALPFTDHLENYRGRIKIQLQGYSDYFGINNEVWNPSWEDLFKEYINSELFGLQLSEAQRHNVLLEEAKDLISADIPLTEKIKKYASFIHENVKWDKTYSIYCEDDLDKKFLASEANATEMNLMLGALLKASEVPFRPVLVKLRSEGYIEKEDHNLEQFSYVILKINTDQGPVFMDASDVNKSVFGVREEGLNKHGLEVNTTIADFVEIEPGLSKEIVITDFYLDGRQMLGTVQLKSTGLNASLNRERIISGSFYQHWESLFRKTYPRAFIANAEFIGDDENKEELKLILDVEVNDAFDIFGDSLFLQPVFPLEISTESFSTTSRSHPVNFGYPQSLQCNFQLEIPENYKVVSIPESFHLIGENQMVEFVYAADLGEDKIQINQKITLNKAEYSAEEYPMLLEFLQTIEQKVGEKLVMLAK